MTQDTSSTNLEKKYFKGTIPETIPLNVIDRVFLVPETEDIHGTYFPTSFARMAHLYQMIDRERLVDALMRLDERFPQLRIGYRLNMDKLRLERHPDAGKRQYYESLVTHYKADEPYEEVIAKMMSTNTEPLGTPVNIFYQGDYIYVKATHVIGDARFDAMFMVHLMIAYIDPEKFETFPELDPNFYISIWNVIWRNPIIGVSVMASFIITALQKIFRYRSETKQSPKKSEFETLAPMVSHSPVGFHTAAFSKETVDQLNTLRKQLIPDKKVSLNNIMNVEIALRLQEMEYLGQTVCYTIPVDLRRYIPKDTQFYPNNLASQIRVTIKDTDVASICEKLQQGTTRAYRRFEPLSGMPAEWVLNWLPRHLYDRLHRNWMLNPVRNPERFFVLSNIGRMEDYYAPIEEHVNPRQHGALVPLDTPVIIAFATSNGIGLLSSSFDPRIISQKDIAKLLDFDNEPLQITRNV